jgi:hypothetical protein
MKVPNIFIRHKMPLEKKDWLARYFNRRDQNLTEKWTTRGLVRWLRDFQCSDYELLCMAETALGDWNEDKAFKAVFG